MKIIFINLADKHVLGEKSVAALKIKNGESVYQFNWIGRARSFKEGHSILKARKTRMAS